MTAAATQTMPSPYRRLEILDAKNHANLKFKKPGDYKFARNLNSVPIVLGEIAQAMAHYPVVFTTGTEPMLIAILGARNEENLFVDDAGKWREGAYIPAFVRRYPFILAKTGEDRLVLSADMESGCFTGDGDPIFVDGKPTKVAHRAYEFCHEYHLDFEKTRAFVKTVHEHGLQKSKRSSITTPSGTKLNLVGFSAVDLDVLEGLDNRTANTLRKNGWLGALYLHAASLERLKTFPALIEARRTGAKKS